MAKHLQIEQVNVSDLVPYDKNPRINEPAVEAVKTSIENFGFLIPCVIDSKNVVVAGHTRLMAAKELQLETIPCIKIDHLTKKQVNTFRVIDNKTSELAEWDMGLLAEEIAELSDSGIDFVPYGWSQEEIDCLSDFVSDDCLNTEEDTGVNTAHVGASAGHISVDAKSIKVSIGEINFFVDVAEYKEWAHEVRKRNDFDLQLTIDDLAGKLGLNARRLKDTKKKKSKTRER